MTDQDQSVASERAIVEGKNRQALVDLMERYSVTLSYRDFDKWRPTVPTAGEIDGFWHLGILVCVATDGMQGLFVDEAMHTANLMDASVKAHAELRHIQQFRWSVPVINMVSYYDTIAKRNKIFQVVKDCGAPPPLFSVPKAAKPPSEKTKKKSKRQSILDSL